MLKLTLLAALLTTAAHAEQNTQSFYDSHGNFAGAAHTHGDATTLTDKNGRFVGSAINRGDGTAPLYRQCDAANATAVRRR
jgi:hypothetical protein